MNRLANVAPATDGNTALHQVAKVNVKCEMPVNDSSSLIRVVHLSGNGLGIHFDGQSVPTQQAQRPVLGEADCLLRRPDKGECRENAN